MTNINASAYIPLLIQNNQTAYTFPFWSQQDATKKNSDIVVQILNGSNIRTLIESKDYTVEINPSNNGGTVSFGKNGTTFIPSQSDGQYLLIVSNVPFKQGDTINKPPTAEQIQSVFDRQQQQINQLKDCCDRAIHTQFDPTTNGYPVISVATKDFKPNHLVILDHTGKTIVDAGFGQDEIDELKKQAKLIAQNIQTIANFAASAGASAGQAAKDRLDALQAVTDATRILGETKAAGTQAVTDITRLKTAALNAISAAKTEIATLTRTSVAEIAQKLADALAKLQPEIQKAIDASKIAVQAATDGQTAEANAKASEQATKAIEASLTPINNLFKGAGNKDDVVARNQAGAWAVESGGDHLKSVMLDLMANGQLLWRDQDQIVPIDKTSFGGGGSGGGTSGPYDHKIIHLAQDDGTAPVTKQSEAKDYAMLQVPYADPTDQAARSGKMPKVNALGDNWEYINMPAPDTIFQVKPTAGTTATTTLDLTSIALPNVSTTYTMSANYDKPTNTWSFATTQGGNSMSTIPNPPNDGKVHYVATTVAPNGGVVYSTPLVPFPVPTSQDVGKVAVVDATHKAFEYVVPLADTEVTKRVMKQSGVIDSPEIKSKTGLTFTLKPFSVAFTDPNTMIMQEHSYIADSAITVPQDSTTTVYIKPSDWSFNNVSGEPTEAIREANIVLCVVYSKSDIQIIKWAYDPISHQERVLADMGRGIGAFAKGIYLAAEAGGLISKTDGYVFDFIGSGQYSKHVVGDLASFFTMTEGLIAASETKVLLQKIYYDRAGKQEKPLDKTHKTVVHNIVTGASLTTSGSLVINKAIIVIGSTTYDSKVEAKKFLAKERDNVEIASLIAGNMVLIAQIIIDVADTSNSDIEVYNYAGLKSSASAVTRKDSLPQGAASDDNSVLKYQNGAYTLDKTIIPAIVDPAIQDGQLIVSAGGNKFKGIDPATVKPGLTKISDKMVTIGLVFKPNQALTPDSKYTSGATGVTGFGIEGVTFKPSTPQGAAGHTYDVILDLSQGVIKNQDQIIGVEMYMILDQSPYTLTDQFTQLSSPNTVTSYCMFPIVYANQSKDKDRRISITLFFNAN